MKINSYKSIWEYDPTTRCYARKQKLKYPLQFFDNRFTRKIPYMKSLAALLGKKPQGVDYYRFYESFIKRRDQGKWINEYQELKKVLKSVYGIDLCDPKRILDISGEPGFFARDAQSQGHEVSVTAYADNVALAMKQYLNLESKTYNYNSDSLQDIYQGEPGFDYIFIRYSIGFCLDIQTLFSHLRKLLNENGMLIVTYTDASRSIIARWMFEDYTYLKQYDTNFLINVLENERYTNIGTTNLFTNKWDDSMHPVQKLLSKLYTRSIFKGVGLKERYQTQCLIVAFKGT